MEIRAGDISVSDTQPLRSEQCVSMLQTISLSLLSIDSAAATKKHICQSQNSQPAPNICRQYDNSDILIQFFLVLIIELLHQ